MYISIVLCIAFVLLVQLCKFGEPRFSKKRPKIVTNTTKSVTYRCGSMKLTPPVDLISGIKFKLYVISHDEKSHTVASEWTRCKPWATVVRIPTTKFFESIVYKEVLPALVSDWEGLDFVGIATYRSLKFSPLEKIKTSLELGHFKPYDVMPLYTTGENMMDQAVSGHTTRFVQVWDNLLRTMGFNEKDIRKGDRAEVFLRNSILIRPAWLKKLSKFMISAMDIVQTNATIHADFITDAHYQESIYRKAVAQRVFHTDYYQWHPFIFERLPVFFLQHNNASVFGTLRETEWFDFENSEQIFKGL